jgi:RimJ/RimL family protein N-acetyltransferase
MRHLRTLLLVVSGFAALICSCSGSGDTETVEDLIERVGIGAAIDELRDQQPGAGDKYDLSLASLLEVGEKYYRSGDQDIVAALARFTTEVYPDSVRSHRSAALAFHLLGLRSEARHHIARAFDLDTLDLATLIQLKKITFVPLDFTPPESLITEDFRIRPIRPEDAELDYKAIMTSLDHLRGTLGQRNWPSAEMTLEEDRQSLTIHAREYETREGFCYTVLNPDETECLGCVYINPSRWDDHDAEVIVWVSKNAFERGLDPVLDTAVRQWLADEWPFERMVYPGREVPWDEFFARLGEQDKHRH